MNALDAGASVLPLRLQVNAFLLKREQANVFHLPEQTLRPAQSPFDEA
jgi:hypothetical protein